MNFIKKFWKWLTVESEWGGRILLIVLVFAILGAAILLSGPKPQDHMIIPTPRPKQLTGTPVANGSAVIPSTEYVQTTGVIVGVVTIILVIIIGTLIQLKQDQKRQPPQE
ncbi:MAG TPA: hypothetical protein PK040_03440 [Anaerolineaceae bacterium]|nr:hypothetical protein [Anaerolineaceae bacterium]